MKVDISNQKPYPANDFTPVVYIINPMHEEGTLSISLQVTIHYFPTFKVFNFVTKERKKKKHKKARSDCSTDLTLIRWEILLCSNWLKKHACIITMIFRKVFILNPNNWQNLTYFNFNNIRSYVLQKRSSWQSVAGSSHIYSIGTTWKPKHVPLYLELPKLPWTCIFLNAYKVSEVWNFYFYFLIIKVDFTNSKAGDHSEVWIA